MGMSRKSRAQQNEAEFEATKVASGVVHGIGILLTILQRLTQTSAERRGRAVADTAPPNVQAAAQQAPSSIETNLRQQEQQAAARDARATTPRIFPPAIS